MQGFRGLVRGRKGAEPWGSLERGPFGKPASAPAPAPAPAPGHARSVEASRPRGRAPAQSAGPGPCCGVRRGAAAPGSVSHIQGVNAAQESAHLLGVRTPEPGWKRDATAFSAPRWGGSAHWPEDLGQLPALLLLTRLAPLRASALLRASRVHGQRRPPNGFELGKTKHLHSL